MQYGTPIESMTKAVTHALETGLASLTLPGKEGWRPTGDEIEVWQFPQTWGSTALGFRNSIGGQALVMAYTTVIIGPECDACVYFNGGLAYRIDTELCSTRHKGKPADFRHFSQDRPSLSVSYPDRGGRL